MIPSTETDAQTEERDPRRCTHAKGDGTLCNGWATKATGMCPGHSRMGLAASPEAARDAASLSGEKRSEQAETRKQRAVDVYRAAVEEHAATFVAARVAIASDPTAPAGDRLRAMEQLENRGLGKPKETVAVETDESDAEAALKALTPEERLALWQGRGLHAVG